MKDVAFVAHTVAMAAFDAMVVGCRSDVLQRIKSAALEANEKGIVNDQCAGAAIATTSMKTGAEVIGNAWAIAWQAAWDASTRTKVFLEVQK